MGIKKLLENLRSHLSRAERKKKVHCDRIDEILEKLKEKEKKLKRKLEREKRQDKRKKLKAELRVLSVQLRKGEARRQELKDRCGSIRQ
jgi:chromosome segregation ATPase